MVKLGPDGRQDDAATAAATARAATSRALQDALDDVHRRHAGDAEEVVRAALAGHPALAGLALDEQTHTTLAGLIAAGVRPRVDPMPDPGPSPHGPAR